MLQDPHDIVLAVQFSNSEREHHFEETAKVPRVATKDAESVQAVGHKPLIYGGIDTTKDLFELCGKRSNS